MPDLKSPEEVAEEVVSANKCPNCAAHPELISAVARAIRERDRQIVEAAARLIEESTTPRSGVLDAVAKEWASRIRSLLAPKESDHA